MQIIDKSLSTVKLLFTLTENTSITNPFYLLILNSRSTNKTYRFVLPANTSAWTNRIDSFLIDQLIFKDVETGSYYYQAYQSLTSSTDETLMGEVIESGLINVIDTTSEQIEQFTTVTNPETDNDFITVTL